MNASPARVRRRLTFAFAIGLGLVMLGFGAFVYTRTGSVLLVEVDAGLRSRAQVLAADVRAGGPASTNLEPSLIEADEAFAQIADTGGRIVASSRIASRSLLVPAADLPSIHRTTFVDDVVPGIDDVTRVLAVPVDAGGERLILMVGTSLQDRRDEMVQLALTLLIGGAVALAAMTVGAWFVIGAALRPVDEAMDRERRLVDRAAHELRTPLAVQRVDLDLALTGPQTVPELSTALRSVSEENEHLTKLADDLLVLSRARGGALSVSPEDVSLQDLLREAVARNEPRARDAHVELTAQPAAGGVPADPVWLRQAIDNLVRNAIRHTPPGGRVQIRADRRDGWVSLVVQDTGPGFSETVLRTGFVPFTRMPGSDPEGTGLGLPVVSSVAKAHGGTASIENPPEGGARATLRLPGRPEPAARGDR
jgi:two-component system, OmpR family, sensor kinase